MMEIPLQTEAQTLQTIFGAALCLLGWLLVSAGTRLAGLSLGAVIGIALAQTLAQVAEFSAPTTGWTLLLLASTGALLGMLLTKLAARVLFALTGLLLGVMIADGIHAVQSSPATTPPRALLSGFLTPTSPSPPLSPATPLVHNSQQERGSALHFLGRPLTQERLQVMALGALAGTLLGVFASRFLTMILTSWTGTMLLALSLPPLQERLHWLPGLFIASVLIQASLAYRFRKRIENGLA